MKKTVRRLRSAGADVEAQLVQHEGGGHAVSSR